MVISCLKVSDLSCGYGARPVIKHVNMEINPGEIICILGPNGTGKTTYFKTLLGFLKLLEGRIYLEGRDISLYTRYELARKIGYVPQSHTTPFPFTVLDVVVMGRSAHLGLFASPGKRDYEIAIEALASLDILYLKDRIFSQISGGERQMVLIARVLTQQTNLLVMDEPTSNLDFGNQVRVLSHINNLVKKGISVIMTSHFPDHAFLCSGKVALMYDGKLLDFGDANEVMTEESLKKIYGIDVRVTDYEHEGRKMKNCIPLL